MRTLVVGSGGIGGIVTATLVDAGWDVTLLCRGPRSASPIAEQGLRAQLGRQRLVARPLVLADVQQAKGRFDLALLCTQATDVERVARAVAGYVRTHGIVLCLQNGLCEPRVACALARLGDPAAGLRVGGAVVSFAASKMGPRHVVRTASGGFTLGLLGGPPPPELSALATALRPAGPARLTDNLLGARWAKLAISCAVTPISVLSGGTLGRCIGHLAVRRLALSLISEALLVARRERVSLAKVARTIDLGWLDLAALPSGMSRPLALGYRHALVYALGFRFRKLRSSMLAAIEDGKPPAIDHINGEIVARARHHGLATPHNEAVVDAVWRLARGQDHPSLSGLLMLANRCF